MSVDLESLVAEAFCTRTWDHTHDGIPCSTCRKEAALVMALFAGQTPEAEVANKLADGFHWQPDHKLLDPDGYAVAHIWQAFDGSWLVVDSKTGRHVVDRLVSLAAAVAVAENLYRPCSFVDVHVSHGICPCDNDRAPQSIYCNAHTRSAEVAP